jgi:hypothetical protein
MNWGQHDGDASGGNPFGASLRAAPWLASDPPWHMWGTTQQLILRGGIGTGLITFTQQLTRVAYKRPETWHWLFVARLISAPDAGGGEVASINIFFNVQVGLGRSMFTLAGFEHFQWGWAAAPAPLADALRWSTVGRRPPRTTPDVEAFDVQELVAQDIQVSADCVFASTIAGNPDATVEVGAFWAPKTHVRPDWLQLDVQPEAQFPGQETAGR